VLRISAEAAYGGFRALLGINFGVYQGFFEMITGAPAPGTMCRAVGLPGGVE
jgi:hypothetical protein